MRTALIGCGNIGSKRAAEIARHPQSTLALVVDADEGRAKALASRYGCAHATRAERVLEAEVGAVVVSVPTRHAHGIVRPLLDAGCHVLCEKPLGCDLDEARDMVEAARARGVVLEVGLNLRFDAGMQRARQLAAEGALGDLYFLKCEYVNGAVLTNTNGIGSLLDIGIHALDLVLWFMGDVDSVYGELNAHESERDDNGFALLRRDGTLAAVHFSFVRWRNLFRFEASGSRGYVLVESLPKWGMQVLTHGRRVYPSGPPEETRIEFQSDTSWEREWDHFVRCATGQRPQEDAMKGVRSMRVAALIRESARRRAVLEVSGWPEPGAPPALVSGGGAT